MRDEQAFVFFLVVLLPTFLFSYAIARDASRRGMSRLWGFIGLFSLLGLIIYLIIRKPKLITYRANPVAAPKREVDNTFEDLKKLGDLKAAGIITEEEFVRKKNALLNKIK